jgi:hypothetical protein
MNNLFDKNLETIVSVLCPENIISAVPKHGRRALIPGKLSFSITKSEIIIIVSPIMPSASLDSFLVVLFYEKPISLQHLIPIILKEGKRMLLFDYDLPDIH